MPNNKQNSEKTAEQGGQVDAIVSQHIFPKDSTGCENMLCIHFKCFGAYNCTRYKLPKECPDFVF